MGEKAKGRSATRYPLWIIAVSLAVIAICLVIDVARKQLGTTALQNPPTSSAVSNPPARKANVPAATRLSLLHRASMERIHSEALSVGPEEGTSDSGRSAANVFDQKAPRPNANAIVASGGFAARLPPRPGGEIIGKVILRGEAPAEKVIEASRNRTCADSGSSPLSTRFFVTAPDGGLANAIVFIKQGLPARKFAIPTNHLQIAFTNCQIEPYANAVMRGQVVSFLDEERLSHPVRIRSEKDREISFLLNPGMRSRDIRLEHSGLWLPITCADHSWESAHISVFDHPYFAVTSADGHFKIEDVPPGRYVLEAVHQKATGTNGVLRSISVTPGKATRTSFAIDVTSD